MRQEQFAARTLSTMTATKQQVRPAKTTPDCVCVPLTFILLSRWLEYLVNEGGNSMISNKEHTSSLSL